MDIILICLAIKHNGNWDKIYDALKRKEKVKVEDITIIENKIKNKELHCTTILDKDYPEKLKEAYKPPFVIFWKGRIEILNNKFIMATGNQHNSNSMERINQFLPEIEKSYKLIVTNFKGLDKDIISKSKKGFLYICASGIEKEKTNKFEKENLWISEYPQDASPSVEKFRNRNRIIAAFAESLVLFSTQKNSKINHLVSAFLNLGKEIYCFPGDGSTEDGNSELIKQGANLITSIKDISS